MKFIDRFNTPVHQEQIRALYQQSPFIFLGIVLTMSVMTYFFWGRVEQQILLTWLALNIGLTVARVVLVKSFHRIKPIADNLPKWGVVFAISSTLSGMIWGSTALLFIQPNSIETVLLVSIVLTGMSASSLVPLSAFIPAYYGFSVFALVPLALVMLGFDGNVFVIIGYLTILFLILNLGYAFIVNQNMSDSIKLRFENIDLIKKLQKQKGIAEKANTDKSRFLAATSHDLRQPLHALELYLGALNNLLSDKEHKELLAKSRQSSSALSELLGAIMDISQLDAGKVVVNRVEVDIEQVLQLLYAEYKNQAELLGIELKVDIEAMIYVETDLILLTRILRNLVSNALEHSKATKILLSSKLKANKVCIEVHDNGCGISDAESEKVFSEFYQLNNPERDRNKGLGLGLSIVKRLTELLGHEIFLETKKDKGSCFRLEMSAIDHSNLTSSKVTLEDNLDISGLFILLIEDEATVRDAMRTLLKQWGCELAAAGSLNELEKELNSLPYPVPDLIIADYRLRENKNGVDAITVLRKRFNEDVAAIVISGDTDIDVSKRAKNNACTFINKPVSPQQLQATIHLLMKD